MPIDGNPLSHSDTQSRRRILQAFGGAGAVAMAGCLGGDDENGNGNGNGNGNSDPSELNVDPDESEIVKDTFVGRLKDGGIPPDIQFNQFHPGNFADQINAVIFDNLIHWSTVDGTYWPMIAREWDVPEEVTEGDTVTIHLRDDPPHLWHDGDPVTAQDVVTQNRLQYYQGTPIWDFIDEVEATDEFTLEYTVSRDTNRDVFMANVLPQEISVKHDIYEEYLQAFEEADGEDEEDEALADLLNWRIELDDVVANGPFVPVEATAQRMFAERFEDYTAPANLDHIESVYDADWQIPNFPNFEWLFADEEEELPNFQAYNWDGSRANPNIGKDEIPSDVYEYRPDLQDLGESLGFNFDDEYMEQREVRQAIAHIVDRKEVTEVMNAEGQDPDYIEQQVPTTVTGMADDHADEWLGDSLDDYETYNNGENTEEHLERATELLENAGFSQDDDTWMTPDGEVWRPEFRCPPAWEKSTDPTVSVLRRFGIEAELTVDEAGAHWGNVIPERNFDGIGHIWIPLGSTGYHPWAYYEEQLRRATRDDPSYPIDLPEEIEVPETIGDPDSDPMTVNIPEQVTKLAEPIDDDQVREITAELAWVYNQVVPQIPLRRHSEAPCLNVDEFVWPERHSTLDEYINWSSEVMAHGGLRVKYEGE